ncbi:MAG TPA: hypothetical protein VFI08_06355 [Spirochaetia bacterium]|nr:hypothetical protein [Spirochaetia bacterium]
MKRRVRALVLFLASAVTVLSLSTCQVLFGGPFSGLVAQLTAQKDISSLVTAANASTYNLSILQSAKAEYVLLYSSSITDTTQNQIIVLSPELKVLNTFTVNDVMNIATPIGRSMSGNGAVTHLVDGHIIIGNVEMAPSGGGLAILDKLSTPNNPVDVTLMGSTIVGPSTASYTWTGFGTGPGTTMSWTVYAADWSGSSTQSTSLGSSAQVVGVFTNPEDDTSNVAYFVFSDGSGRLTFIQAPKDPDLVNAFPSGLIGNSSYSTFTKKDLNSFDLHVTRDSVLGFNGNSHSWVRFTPSDPGNESSLYVGSRPDSEKTEFSFSGGYFCVWDPTTRTISRADDWW